VRKDFRQANLGVKMNISRKYLMASAIVLLGVLFVLFESVKHFLFPSLSVFHSHPITLLFVMIIGIAVTYFIHKINSTHYRQIRKRQLENTKLGEALLTSEGRYRAVFDHSSNAILLLDGESWEKADFNRKAYESLGYSRLEFERISPKDYEVLPFQDIKKRFERIANGGAETYEAQYRKKDGEVVDVLVNVKNLSVGGKKYFLCVSEDIGERKKIQKKSIEQYEFLNTLLETIPSPVFYKDRLGKYIGCNKAFEDFLGMNRQEILGKDVYEISPGEIADEYFKKDEALFRNPGQQVYEWKVKTKKLGQRDVVFSKAVFKDIKGNVAGIIGVILDITDHKHAELALQRSRDALIEHNRILAGWTSPEVLYNPDFEEIVTRITETVADILKVERVSLWMFNTDFSKLYCTDLFEKKTGRRSNGSELDVKTYPAYFNTLRNERLIVSNNPPSDPRYAELLDVYVRPNRIAATLDVPVFVAGEIIGAICIEHQGEKREWTLEEQNFAISVGNVFSLVLEIARHRKLQKSIHSAKDNFVNIVEKLPCPVLIIDMKGTVKYVNAACESFFGPKVKDMLGAKFPYALPADSEGRIDIMHPGRAGEKVELVAVKTRWDSEPTRLITFYEHSSK
jgi:PAS domain S-box-containing protein